jgi:hypothetical protein
MSGEDLARSLFEGANARDWGAVAALHTDDHLYHDPQGPTPEPGGAGMAEHMGFYVAALDGRWEVDRSSTPASSRRFAGPGMACMRTT